MIGYGDYFHSGFTKQITPSGLVPSLHSAIANQAYFLSATMLGRTRLQSTSVLDNNETMHQISDNNNQVGKKKNTWYIFGQIVQPWALLDLMRL